MWDNPRQLMLRIVNVRAFVRQNNGLGDMGGLSVSKYYNLRSINTAHSFDEPTSPPSDE